MIGQTFGKLTVVSQLDRKVGGKPYFLCRCECGNTHEARGDHLRSGEVNSCGCGKPRHYGAAVEAWGESKPLGAWAEDPRRGEGVTLSALRQRFRDHGAAYPAEEIISRPSGWSFASGNPGVVRQSWTLDIEAWGEVKTPREWLADPRCGANLTAAAIRLRLSKLQWPAERAISTPATGAGRKGHQIEAWGESKTLNQWAADPRARAGLGLIRARLAGGWAAEDAIGEPTDSQKRLAEDIRKLWGVEG